jgi:S1-C subfamily serine protease
MIEPFERRSSRISSRVLAVAFAGAAIMVGAGCAESQDGSGDAPAIESGKVESRTVDSVAIDPSGNVFNPAEIYENAADGVIAVGAIFGDGGSNPFGSGAAQGSGFVLSEDGEIVTNAHVITDGEGEARTPAEEVFVEFRNGEVIPAEVIGFDPFTDTGLLKVDPDAIDLQPLPIGNSDRLVVGEPLAVIGSPFGEDSSLSTGIVSQIARSIRSLTDFRIEGAIQTDASINPGNSGGPMLDSNGDVIGISQQIITRSGANDGVGFGVPINSVIQSVEQLREQGEVRYAYIGVSTQAIYRQLAERLGLDSAEGVIVAEVVDGGPADRAGIKGGKREIEFQGARIPIGGDIIVEAAGEKVVEAEDLGRIIAAQRVGDTIEMVVIRDGRRETIEVELGERPTALDNG